MNDKGSKTILLVEDDVLLATFETLTLEENGYRVIVAHSGERAIEVVEKEPGIDLVLMDIDMGAGMDGTEAARAILERRELPLAFLSSHTEPEIVEKTEGITSYGYIVKDSGETVLLASVRMAFRLFDAKSALMRKTREVEAANEALQAAMEEMEAANEELIRTDLELRESGELYRSLFANMLNGCAYCRMIFEDGRPMDFVYLDVNDAFESLTGLRNVMGKKVSDVVPGILEADPSLFETYGRVASTGKSERFESYVASLGEWFEVSVYCPRREHFIAVFDVVTERKRAEEALREREERYRRLAALSPDVIYRMSLPDGEYAYVSPASADVFGYVPEEFYADPSLVRRIMHPDWIPYFEEQWRSLLEGRMPPTYEYRIVRKDGSVGWVNQRNVLLVDGGGRPIAIEGIVTDVTERKRVEAEREAVLMALRIDEERYRRAQAMGHVGNWEYDLRTARFWGSDEAKRIYGFDPEQDDFTTDEVENCIPDRERVHAALIGLIERGEKYDLEFEIRPRMSSVPKIIASVAELQRDEEGNPAKVVGVIQDVTERRRTEDAVNALLAEKDLFLKEVHHRVKNNMNIAMSLLSLQAGSLTDPACAAALREAGSRLQSMSILYDRLYRTGDLREMSLRDYLPELVRQTVDLFPNGSAVRVETEIGEIVVGARILSSVGIIVNELVVNAMKHAFTERPGTIGVAACRTGGGVRLVVRDDGVGLSVADRLEKGAGVGMQIVRLLTNQLGGTLTIAGENGTSFSIEFAV